MSKAPPANARRAKASQTKAAKAKAVTASKAAKAKAARESDAAEGHDESNRPSRALGVHYQALDGIRAVGMAAIFFGHSEFRVFQGAYMGLSLFFTLSGFLITSILLRRRDQSGPMRLASFWSQRYRRLMPAALLTLFGIVIFGATVADVGQVKEIPGQVAAAAAQVVNWFFIYTEKSYMQLFAAPSPVQHFWSLAIEEQFYVVMPIVFWVIVRYTRTLKPIAAFFGLGAIASTLWMIWLYGQGASLDRLYYGTDTRAAEILVGGLLAVVLHQYPLRSGEWSKRILAVVGIVAFGLTLWAWVVMEMRDSWVYRGGFLAFSFVSCALIVSLVSGGPVAWLLSWGFLPALGRITYGLYLFHWPIMLWLTSDRTGLEGWTLFGLQVGVTLAAAIASYHLLEMPIRRGIPNWPKGPMRWAVAPTVAIVIVSMAFVLGNREVPGGQSLLAFGVAPMPEVQEGLPKVLVVGDSVSFSMGRGLERWAADTGSAVVWNTAAKGCGILDEGKVGAELGRQEDLLGPGHCELVRKGWIRHVAEFDPDLVIMLSTGWDLRDRQLSDWPEALSPGDDKFDDYLLREYREAVDIFSARGAEVLWLQGPCSDSRAIADDSGTDMAVFDPDRLHHLNDELIPRLMEDRDEVKTFDMFSILCPGGVFAEDLGPVQGVRPDGAHLTDESSLWFAENYGAAMIAAGLS